MTPQREAVVVVLLAAGCTVIALMGIIAGLVAGSLIWR